MKTNLIYREDDGWYIGHLQEYPDFESQGETLQELQENLLDIYSDIQEGLVTNATPSKVLELVI